MVSIRPVDDADLAAFYDHQADPVANRLAAFPARTREEFLAHWARIRADPTVVHRTVVVDGRVAGSVSSWAEESGRRLVGYWLGREFWGRGVATAGLGLFLAELPWRPVYAHVAAHNAGSIRVLEKCGFTPVAPGQPGWAPSVDDVAEHVYTLDR
jgi:RimJ/RimL family protein N-acetyltransferase